MGVDAVGDRELALLLEPEDRDRGEELRDRADAEERADRHRSGSGTPYTERAP